MKRIIICSILGLVLSFVGGGCVTYGHPGGFGPMGYLFSYTEIGVSGKKIDSNNPELRTGKACSSRVFVPFGGTFALGSGTVAQAARKGNIRTIHTVNKEMLNVLLIWSRLCTVVTGTFEEPPGPPE